MTGKKVTIDGLRVTKGAGGIVAIIVPFYAWEHEEETRAGLVAGSSSFVESCILGYPAGGRWYNAKTSAILNKEKPCGSTE